MDETTISSDLYQAILARRSVRRYTGAALDQDKLAQVEQAMQRVDPLIPENNFQVLFHDGMLKDKDFVTSMGAYGYIVTPPHAIAPYTTGKRHPLVDLGYRVEQIVVRLTALNVGTCYIGNLSRESANRGRLGLPVDSRCGALLVFGSPAKSAGDRAIDSVIRLIARCDTRLPVEQIFFHGTFDNPGLPPQGLSPIITAARLAPSAVNAQPWRFLWQDERLHLFVIRQNFKYGRGTNQEYRLYDGGICMANIKLALEALGMEGAWRLHNEEDAALPDHPSSMQALATLHLG
jgi:hypothetical protein